MNRLLLGALLGAFLAGLRLDPGADLLQWPVVEAEQAYRMRAGGLVLAASRWTLQTAVVGAFQEAVCGTCQTAVCGTVTTVVGGHVSGCGVGHF